MDERTLSSEACVVEGLKVGVVGESTGERGLYDEGLQYPTM